MTAASKLFDFSFRDALLRDPENAALYLAEYLEEGNMKLFQEALRNVAKAQEGGLWRNRLMSVGKISARLCQKTANRRWKP